MKDYVITITVTVPFEAKNQAQSEERAQQVENALKLDLNKKATWAGDMEMNYEVAEA